MRKYTGYGYTIKRDGVPNTVLPKYFNCEEKRTYSVWRECGLVGYVFHKHNKLVLVGFRRTDANKLYTGMFDNMTCLVGFLNRQLENLYIERL